MGFSTCVEDIVDLLELQGRDIYELKEQGVEGHEVIILYFNAYLNVMEDEDSFPIFDIHKLITPSQLYLFRMSGQDMTVFGIDGQIIGLMWPVEGDCERCWSYEDCHPPEENEDEEELDESY